MYIIPDNPRRPASVKHSPIPPPSSASAAASAGRTTQYGRYVGESEGALRQTFAEASRRAPCLIVFDEVDTLCPRRDQANSEAQRRVVSTMLALLDGVDAQERVRVYVQYAGWSWVHGRLRLRSSSKAVLPPAPSPTLPVAVFPTNDRTGVTPCFTL